MSELPFPRHSARTLRFSLGAPRNFTISPDGQRVVYVRSGSGIDRTGRLFELDLNSKNTREIVNPLDLLKSGDEKISIEEQARRERAREAAAGITNYSSDANLKKSHLHFLENFTLQIWKMEKFCNGRRKNP